MPKIHRDRPPTDNTNINPVPAAPTVVPEPPASSALKARWVTYARAIGVDSSGTKAQIIKRVGLT